MDKRLDADDPCPARDGFSMPAEWVEHTRTWMCWPCRTEAWGGPEGLLRAKQAVARVARAISSFEPVVMAVRAQDAAEPKLACAGRIETFEVTLDDSWARDIGPTSCTRRTCHPAVYTGTSRWLAPTTSAARQF